MIPILISLVLGIVAVIICWAPFYIFQIEKFPIYFLFLFCLMPALATTSGPYLAALIFKRDYLFSRNVLIIYSIIGGFFSMKTTLLIYLSHLINKVGLSKFIVTSMQNPIDFLSFIITSETLLSRTVILFIAGFFTAYFTIKNHTLKQVKEIRRVQKLQEEWKRDSLDSSSTMKNNTTISRLLSKR